MKKNELMRYLGLALGSVMMVASLAACGNDGNTVSLVSSPIESDEKQTDDNDSKTDDSQTDDSKTDDGKTDDSEDKKDDRTSSDDGSESKGDGEYYSESIALYESFMAGNATMTIDKVDFSLDAWGDYEPALKSDGAYTFDDFFKAFFEDRSAYNDGDYAVDGMSYTYVDCGQDGTPELVLNFASKEYGSESNNLLIIKDVNGKLVLCKWVSEGVRGVCYVNSAGVIYDGGSGGATDWYDSYYGIDANGDAYLIYESETGSFDLYSETENYSQIAADLGVTDIFVTRYSFEKYDGDYTDYEQFLRNCDYTFARITDSGDTYESDELYAEDSNYVKFISRYTDNWHTPGDMDTIISERLASFGLTDGDLGQDDTVWTAVEGHEDIYNIAKG